MKTISTRNAIVRAAEQWRRGELSEKAFKSLIDDYTARRKPGVRCSCPQGRCQGHAEQFGMICKRPDLSAPQVSGNES